MKKINLIITYLYHSGFKVEIEDNLLIFDYYQPFFTLSGDNSPGIITGDSLIGKSPVYVFSSHNHHDHFDSKILGWAETNPEITYILSDDIKNHPKKGNLRQIKPYQKFEDGIVSVQTFGSTDQGVSFLVHVNGINIFHAGDLNWWYWKEDTEAEREKASKAFKGEIEKIKGHPIDIAFFPVDPRLEEFYAFGADYFIKEVTPKVLIPMHFGDNYQVTGLFKNKNLPVKTVEIKQRGQKLNL